MGLKITRLQIDHRFCLDIESTDCALTLVFKAECYLQVANRIRHRLLATEPGTLTPLLSVLNQPLVRFMVASNGDCKLLLADSTVIWTDASAEWESHGHGTLASASFSGRVAQAKTPRLVAQRQR